MFNIDSQIISNAQTYIKKDMIEKIKLQFSLMLREQLLIQVLSSQSALTILLYQIIIT
jgi:hypothetical protein